MLENSDKRETLGDKVVRYGLLAILLLGAAITGVWISFLGWVGFGLIVRMLR